MGAMDGQTSGVFARIKALGTAVLRRIFGAGRAYDGWRQFAREAGREFVDRGYIRPDSNQPGRWLFGPWVEVHFRVRGYPAVLETFLEGVGKNAQRYTILHLTLPWKGVGGFGVSREGVLSRLGKLVGMPDLQVGHPDFDRAFVIKGSDERTVRSLLDDVGIRQTLLAQRGGAFGLRPANGQKAEGRAELYFEEIGLINEPDRLKALSRLFEETVDRAQRLGLLEAG
jgi:hypothetical protein